MSWTYNWLTGETTTVKFYGQFVELATKLYVNVGSKENRLCVYLFHCLIYCWIQMRERVSSSQ